jgi:hypothetical protein
VIRAFLFGFRWVRAKNKWGQININFQSAELKGCWGLNDFWYSSMRKPPTAFELC